MASPPAARSIGEHTAATAPAVAAADSPASSAQRSSALPPSEMPTASSGLARPRAQALQHPADLLEITRVVGARRQVQRARTAAEVRHGIGPAQPRSTVREGPRVVARRRAFEPVEQHQQRCAGIGRIDKVDIDEVAVRRVPAFAPVGGRAARGWRTAPARWSADGRRAASAGRGNAAPAGRVSAASTATAPARPRPPRRQGWHGARPCASLAGS